jgi:hypothetical protein
MGRVSVIYPRQQTVRWVVHTSELTADAPVHDGLDSGFSLTAHLDVTESVESALSGEWLHKLPEGG